MPERVVIVGAAGRDFHNFNVLYRDDPRFEVVAFTATQIPDIAGRRYPPELAGDLYPEGVPIFPEEELESLIERFDVDLVLFSYSDVTHEQVMHLAARSVAAGAAFELAGRRALLKSTRPVIAVTAVRTGAGKSQTSRLIHRMLADRGLRSAAIRHPMPYGDLAAQRVQRFATYDDLADADTTIEEREEYEPYISEGSVIFAGVDYGEILAAAEAEADVIVWDGGNNDLSFYDADLTICVADPFRAGHESRYWPGEVNLRIADVVIINKVDTAPEGSVDRLRDAVTRMSPDAAIVEAASPIRIDDPELVTGKRVLVIDDGPTITHGQMPFGAGYVAAARLEPAELIDPRPYAVGSIVGVFEKYDHIGSVLPAMGYGDVQRAELEETIRRAAPDTVVIGTPVDLAGIIDIDGPSTRVYYAVGDEAAAEIGGILDDFLGERGLLGG
jgi:predicted GTPase